MEEIEPVTYLVQGRLAPFFAPVEIGLGERLLVSAMALAYHVPKDEVSTTYRQLGDLGVTAQRLAPQTGHQPPAVADVHRRLFEIAGTGGPGGLQGKLELFPRLVGGAGQVDA